MRRLIPMLLAAALFLCSCGGPHTDTPPQNSAAFTLQAGERWVIRTDTPQVYTAERGLHPLMHDPFWQACRAAEVIPPTLTVCEFDGALYLSDGEDAYTVYRIDPTTLAAVPDGGIARGDTASTLLGLDKTFGFSLGTHGTTYRLERRGALFVRRDAYILPGSRGIYAVSRDRRGSEECLFEGAIQNRNYALSGDFLHFCTEDNTLCRLNLTTRAVETVREHISGFTLTARGYYANEVTATGTHILFHENATGKDNILADGWFWQLCEVGDEVVYIRLTGDMRARLFRHTAAGEVALTDRAVTRVGALGDDIVCAETPDGELLAITLRGDVTVLSKGDTDK